MKKIFSIGAALVLSLFIVVPLKTTAVDAPKNSASTVVNLDNPLGNNNPGPNYIYEVIGGKIIQPALGIVGSLALLMFVYGGFVWLTSSGSPDKIKTGKDIFMWAAIGLVVIFSSYILLKFFLDTIMGKFAS